MIKSKQTVPLSKVKKPLSYKRASSIWQAKKADLTSDIAPRKSKDNAKIGKAAAVTKLSLTFAEAAMATNNAGPDANGYNKTSKVEQLVMLLERWEGARLTELCAVTNWQPHPVRGVLAGTLKHKGHAIVSEWINSIRHCRITAPA